MVLMVVFSSYLFASDYSRAIAKMREGIANNKAEDAKRGAAEAVAADPVRAAQELPKMIEQVQDLKSYYGLIVALAEVKSQKAVENLVVAVKSANRSFRRDLMIALQLNESIYADSAFITLMRENDIDLKVICMDEIAKRMAKDGIEPIISVLKEYEKKNAYVADIATKALVAITGQSFEKAETWKRWWDANKDSFKPAKKEKKKASDDLAGAMGGTTPIDYEDLIKFKKGDVVIVRGVYDTMEEVMDALKIPYTLISKNEFHKLDIKTTKALLLNCDDFTMTPWDKRDMEKIKQYVYSGGYLFTSDWQLQDLLVHIFPDYVKNAGTTNPVDETFEVYPRKGVNGNRILKEVFLETELDYQQPDEKTDAQSAERSMKKKVFEYKWVVDNASLLIDPVESKCETLIVSQELAKKYKKGAVAITFIAGQGYPPKVTGTGEIDNVPRIAGGRVLHILGHFGKQRGESSDEYSLDKMLLNFLIEAKIRTASKKK